MLDILDRGSDWRAQGDYSPPHRRAGRGAAPAVARASVVPAAKLAAGAADAVSVVDTINGAEDADAAGFANAERARRASGAETAAVEGCVAGSEGAAGSASMGGEPVVHDSDALIFRNGIEQDMTPLERAVYEAVLGFRPRYRRSTRALQTLAKTAEGIRVSCGLPMMQADRVRRIELRLRERFALGGELGVYSGAETSTWLRLRSVCAPPQRLLALGPVGAAPGRDVSEAIGAFEGQDQIYGRSKSQRCVGGSPANCGRYARRLLQHAASDWPSKRTIYRGRTETDTRRRCGKTKKLSEDAAEKGRPSSGV